MRLRVFLGLLGICSALAVLAAVPAVAPADCPFLSAPAGTVTSSDLNPTVGELVTFTSTLRNPDGSAVDGYTWLYGDEPAGTPRQAGPAVTTHRFTRAGFFEVGVQAQNCAGESTPTVDETVSAPLTLSGVRVSPATFRRPGRGGSLAHLGATVSYQLSDSATVTFVAERAELGTRILKTCVARPALSRRRSCTRYLPAAQFTEDGTAGPNHFHVTGNKLRLGTYRLSATAHAPSGRTSATVTSNQFRIVR